jgi:hypothetical protein
MLTTMKDEDDDADDNDLPQNTFVAIISSAA